MNHYYPLEQFDDDELLTLAQSDMERKDLEGALLKLKTAVGRSNALPEATAALARVYAQLRLFAKAEQCFERYLQTHPQALLERFELGMTRFDAGKFAQAQQAWDSLLQTHPGYPPAMFYKGLLLARTGQTVGAKQLLEQLLKGVAIDNLYFERAKKLLQTIDAGDAGMVGAVGTRGAVDADDSEPTAPKPYRTEH